jgi:hypothetical protein
MNEPVIDSFELIELLEDSEELKKMINSSDGELLVEQGPKPSSDANSQK